MTVNARVGMTGRIAVLLDDAASDQLLWLADNADETPHEIVRRAIEVMYYCGGVPDG